MYFRLNKIKSLYYSMKQNKKESEKYTFTIKTTDFDVIFLINRTPYELLVGVCGTQFAFVLPVEKGFVTTLPDCIYYRLCEIIQLNYSENHFSSFKFLAELDRAAPFKCTKRKVRPDEIARFKRDVPENEKIYFYGWNDHVKDGRKVRNIKKTREWLGDSVADFCEANNISSMWTDVERKRIDYSYPPKYP